MVLQSILSGFILYNFSSYSITRIWIKYIPKLHDDILPKVGVFLFKKSNFKYLKKTKTDRAKKTEWNWI